MNQESNTPAAVSEETTDPNVLNSGDVKHIAEKADKKPKVAKTEAKPVNDLKAIAQAELDQQATDAKKRAEVALKEAKVSQRERPARAE